MPTAAQVVEVARTYLNVPWKHAGRTRAGLDCAGLIIRVQQDLGISTFDVTGYGTAPDGSMTRILHEQCIPMEPGALPEAGMVAEIRFEFEPQHVGLIVPYYLGGMGLLHSMSRYPRRVTEHRLDEYWEQRIVRLYKLPGVEYGD